eukprot:TRINITY_DN58638_c0_g1_i1.p2 TRINITY_DN58638_c0_g1~~TRINITY_DN58638_c0_g1_i1.p2  ORF type:complete len:135 (-),score=2.90 TRINITY_DN58638_c0_g1_i1:409-792(-)
MGFVPGRRRVEAYLCIAIALWWVMALGYSGLAFFFDLANAFGSLLWQEICAVLREQFEEPLRSLLTTTATRMLWILEDGSRALVVRPRAGVAQGHVPSPQMFVQGVGRWWLNIFMKTVRFGANIFLQ